MSKMNYKFHKFNLSDKHIQQIMKAINDKDKTATSFYLSKKVIMQEPEKGKAVSLLLSTKEAQSVLNQKPFTYYLTKDKISKMRIKNTKQGGILPAIIPAIIAGIGALGGLAGGVSSIVSAVNQRKTDKEKNDNQATHNKALENYLTSTETAETKGNGLILGKGIHLGNGLYLEKYGNGVYIHA